ncbi:hypothetical protein PTQ21_13020 [Paenibacillus marchantiae]|uniref:hypothetical protein n=1 Tax=Paenibacillus marchantiae TaxID=3026433 RepID=UPI00237A3F8F|nr:hypothetical protein [Paenibacillus marchantiae]WDQ35094.1 hypothetical protein PTQ21_13020 [Paenibacillus marchantiae]
MSMRPSMKYGIIVSAVFIIVVPIIIGLYMLNNVVDPDEIMVTRTEVSPELITIKGGFADSISRYQGYYLSHHNNSLFIQIKGSKLPIGGSKDFTISFSNTYGNVDEIYLLGPGNSKKKIWPNP